MAGNSSGAVPTWSHTRFMASVISSRCVAGHVLPERGTVQLAPRPPLVLRHSFHLLEELVRDRNRRLHARSITEVRGEEPWRTTATRAETPGERSVLSRRNGRDMRLGGGASMEGLTSNGLSRAAPPRLRVIDLDRNR